MISPFVIYSFIQQQEYKYCKYRCKHIVELTDLHKANLVEFLRVGDLHQDNVHSQTKTSHRKTLDNAYELIPTNPNLARCTYVCGYIVPASYLGTVEQSHQNASGHLAMFEPASLTDKKKNWMQGKKIPTATSIDAEFSPGQLATLAREPKARTNPK